MEVMQVFGANKSTTYFSETAREAALQARLLYDISPLSTITLLSFETSAEYLIEDKRNGLFTVLRISRPDFYTCDELEAEIRWIKELEKHNPPFVLPQPICGIDGRIVQKIALPTGGICFCSMFAYLHGRTLDEHDDTELVSDFKKLGEITALMHQNALQWNGSETLSRPILDTGALLGSQSRYGPIGSGILASDEPASLTSEQLLLFDKVSSTIKRRLFRFGKSGARFGLIHSDLSLSNIICYKNRFAVTRFNHCGFGWFLYDFASSVSFLEDRSLLPKLTSAWLEGYRRQRNISNEESAEIPTFIMLRRLELLSRLVNRWDTTLPKGYTDDFIEKTATLATNYLRTVQ
jgi:Ser/Thr protein kinase RdoA (MazF antagonist)